MIVGIVIDELLAALQFARDRVVPIVDRELIVRVAGVGRYLVVVRGRQELLGVKLLDVRAARRKYADQ